MKDIRLRDWLNENTSVSEILKHLIDAKNILGALDDYQMKNDQCYPDIEELYNELAYIRAKFTKYVDENLDLLTIDEQIKKYGNVRDKDNHDRLTLNISTGDLSGHGFNHENKFDTSKSDTKGQDSSKAK